MVTIFDKLALLPYDMKWLGSSWGPGAFLGLQIQWSALDVDGGFDSHMLPPNQAPQRFAGFLFAIFYAAGAPK